MNIAQIAVIAASIITITASADAKGKKPHAAEKAEVAHVEYCSSEDDDHLIVYVCSEKPYLPEEGPGKDCAGSVTRKDGDKWSMSWDVVCKGEHHKGSISYKGSGKSDGKKLWVK